MKTCAQYASLNRASIQLAILSVLQKAFPTVAPSSGIESVHNTVYKGIMRKGAIYADSCKTVLLPLNPAQGIAICQGMSGEQLNYSAPHGTGRRFSKKQVNELQRAGDAKAIEFGMEGIF